MKIPKKLKIGGHTYKVQLHDEGEVCAGDVSCGITIRNKGILELNNSLMQSEKELTLFHEIFHVINSQLDHTLLESLAQQVYQVLKDNRFIK